MTDEEWAELEPFAVRAAEAWREMLARDMGQPEWYRASIDHNEAMYGLKESLLRMGLDNG